MAKTRGGGAGPATFIQEARERQQAKRETIQRYEQLEAQSRSTESEQAFQNVADEVGQVWENLDSQSKWQAKDYTGGWAEDINLKLREGQELSEGDRTNVADMDRALAALPVREGLYYRRIGFNSVDALRYFMNNHQVGNTVEYAGYTSTSRKRTAYSFEQSRPEKDVQAFIYGAGAPIEKFSHYGTLEQEVLFPRNSRFVVEAVDKTDRNVDRIYMRQVS